VCQVIEMTGLHKVFKIVGSVEDAVNSILKLENDAPSQINQLLPEGQFKIIHQRGKESPAYFWAKETIAGFDELGISIGMGCPSEMYGSDEPVNGLYVTVHNCAGYIPFDEGFPADYRIPGSPSDGSVFFSQAISFGMNPSAILVSEKFSRISFESIVDTLNHFQKKNTEVETAVIGFALADYNPEKPSLTVGCLAQTGFFNADNEFYTTIENQSVFGAKFLLESINGFQDNTGLEDLTRKCLTLENIENVELLITTFELVAPVVWLFLPDIIHQAPSSLLEIEVIDGPDFEPHIEFLIRRIYGDSAKIAVKAIHGGFSAQTYQVESFDSAGRKLRPTVLKVANRAMIAREAERCQQYALPYIFNNSAMVLGAHYFGDTGALRYNFVGIGGEQTRLKWLTHLFESWPLEKLESIFDKVFREILKPWYGQAIEEKIALFHDHDPTLTFFPMIEEAAQNLFSISSDELEIKIEEAGLKLVNPYWFLKHEYRRMHGQMFDYYTSVCHGDLNMQNILLDQDMNVYLIDFSETRPRSVVSDFARMEAIFMIEYADVEAPEELKAMIEFASGFYTTPRLDILPENSYSGKYQEEMERNVAMARKMRQYALESARGNTTILPYYLALLEWVLPIVCYRSATLAQKRLSVVIAGLLCSKVQELILKTVV
ncbi:MAG: phosphotransferase, partial [Prolixibacteraceae bacterium]|nr:phosphotransferase [Prolixibacteraceae bacterium]